MLHVKVNTYMLCIYSKEFSDTPQSVTTSDNAEEVDVTSTVSENTNEGIHRNSRGEAKTSWYNRPSSRDMSLKDMELAPTRRSSRISQQTKENK